MYKSFKLAALLAVLLGPSKSYAQDYKFSFFHLENLTAVSLLIETLDKNAKACGITEELLTEAFMHPASTSKLKITHDRLDARTPTIYINVTTLNFPEELCVSDLRMWLHSYETVHIEATQRIVRAQVVLWKDGILVGDSPPQHAQHLRTALENMTKKFLAEWNLVNKPQ